MHAKPKQTWVTHLEDFRIYQTTPDLDLGWLENRLFGPRKETEEMAAGSAFHKVMQELVVDAQLGREIASLGTNYQDLDYRFDFNGPAEIELPTIREASFSRLYGDRWVVGKVDGILGNKVIEYKTTESFDGSRFMESFQWRYYLDLSDCDEVLYQVFIVKPFGPPGCFSVREMHRMRQFRYPDLHQDCEHLVEEFSECMEKSGWTS
jgi:hypothetical protein